MGNAIQRLSQDGFAISYNVELAGQKYQAVAHRSRFELTKFGNSETFFVFGELERPDVGAVRGFSSQAFHYAKLAKTFSLPCGLFEAIACFAVCSAKTLDEGTAENVRSTAPTKHWAAFEIPVLYDSGNDKLLYFEKTPLWGAAYYRGFRDQIRKYLGGA